MSQLIRIIGIVIFSSLTTILMMVGVAFYWPILSGIVLILLIAEWIAHQKKLEKSIWQFFRSVKNADHGFKFRDSGHQGMVPRIYQEMNRINDQINELKISLETQERYYQILLDKVSTGIIAIEYRGFIELVNPSALRILETPVLSHIDQIERIAPRLHAHIKHLTPKERIVISLNNSMKPVDVSVITQKIRLRSKIIFIVILQDIREELDQKEVDSWIKLIRVQAHEIRNSLAPIASVAETLMSRTKDADEAEGLKIILERSRHLKSFIESYRTITHLPAPQKTEFSIIDLVERVKILLSDLANYQEVILTITPEGRISTVFADRNQITQVLLNVLRNAYESLENSKKPAVSIVISQQKGLTKLQISDNGPGIPEELQDEIFIPFFTTRVEGTGIGLSLSRQILRRHRGDIRYVGKQGKGASFLISLPH